MDSPTRRINPMMLLAWIKRIRQKRSLYAYFASLTRLQRAIFSVIDNQASGKDDVKLYPVRRAVLYSMQQVRRCFQSVDDAVMLSRLTHLYEILFSLHCLTRRITDKSLFEMCEKEFKCVRETLHVALIKPSEDSFRVFSYAIDGFDELNRSTLQIVTPNPVVFLYFIQGLIALHQELTHIMVMLPHD